MQGRVTAEVLKDELASSSSSNAGNTTDAQKEEVELTEQRHGFPFHDLPKGEPIKTLVTHNMQLINLEVLRGMLRMAVQAIFGYLKEYGNISCVCTLNKKYDSVAMARHPDEHVNQIIICGYGHAHIKSDRREHGVCRHNKQYMEVLTVERVDEDPRTCDSAYAQGDGGLRTYIGMRLAAIPECTICILFLGEHGSDGEIARSTQVLKSVVHELNENISIFITNYQKGVEAEAAKASTVRIQNTLLYLSHEIRNQLVPWTFFVDDCPAGQNREMMNTTLSTVNNILTRVLKMGKAMHSRPAFEYFSLEPMLKACDAYASKLIEMKTDRSSERKVTYERTFRPEEDLKVCADEHNVKQCVMNLISNAHKFTDSGFIRLEGDVTYDPAGKRLMLNLQVRDTGRGVPKEKVETVLQPFGQADTSSVAQKGSGLGLHLCQYMVETTHQGTMTFESEYGKGTVVSLRFPLAYRRVGDSDKEWSDESVVSQLDMTDTGVTTPVE